MSNRNNWRISESDRPPSQFWVDYGNFVMASMMFDSSDEYWETLAKWSDILMRRYPKNVVVGNMIVDYLDGQSKRCINAEEKGKA